MAQAGMCQFRCSVKNALTLVISIIVGFGTAAAAAAELGAAAQWSPNSSHS